MNPHRYLRAEPQYGVLLPGERIVRLQPSLQATLVRVETTPGANALVYNLETAEWEPFVPTFAEMYGRTT